MNRMFIIVLFYGFSQFIYSQNNLALLPEHSFMPDAGKYIFSGWVMEETQNSVANFYNSEITISVADGSNVSSYSVVFKASGSVIDGWQRIIGIVDIPNFDNMILPTLSITMKCNNPDGDCYFDDIRFYPYNGNMKSFVYDEDTQRLMAELDENNYATFYEYDLEGGLVRVKKETERGVFTIQETRSNNHKQ